MELQLVESGEFETIAQFIAAINQFSESQSLHCGTQSVDIFKEMRDYHSRNEFRMVKAVKKGKLIGVLGCDCDDLLQRIWFWGPFVTTGENWSQTALLLYDHFLEITPQAEKLYAYYNEKAESLRAFYKGKGFEEGKSRILQYAAIKPSIKEQLNQPVKCLLYNPGYYAELDALHNAAFPDTYYTTTEMVNLDADKNRIWLAIATENKAVGYIMASENATGEGYIHFLAVNEKHRKKGIGSALLKEAMDWLFWDKKVPIIRLTVTIVNKAQSIYQRVGFTHICTGIGSKLMLK